MLRNACFPNLTEVDVDYHFTCPAVLEVDFESVIPLFTRAHVIPSIRFRISLVLPETQGCQSLALSPQIILCMGDWILSLRRTICGSTNISHATAHF